VLLVAYELSRKTYRGQFPIAVTRAELEILHQHIHDTLKLLEYIPRGNRDLEARIMRNLKHLMGRAYRLGAEHASRNMRADREKDGEVRQDSRSAKNKDVQ
jgi:tRNA C32,U32 (ribose-2'-O)-methylase TrmJ